MTLEKRMEEAMELTTKKQAGNDGRVWISPFIEGRCIGEILEQEWSHSVQEAIIRAYALGAELQYARALRAMEASDGRIYRALHDKFPEDTSGDCTPTYVRVMNRKSLLGE